MTAKLIDTARRSDFQVFVMPNMWGDILTDEAAQIQGGVGTAGSANIGKQHAMFEAIHGSAPRMVTEGRAQYADPSSMIRAGSLLVEHIGFPDIARKLDKAMDVCSMYEKKVVLTGRPNGATAKQLGDYILDTVADPKLESRWDSYVQKK
jgi:isocitrate dehydrogenase (NAD+)